MGSLKSKRRSTREKLCPWSSGAPRLDTMGRARQIFALMFPRFIATAALAFVLVSCARVEHGKITSKKIRRGLPSAYETTNLFRYSEPTVFWVRVEGPDKSGRVVHQDIILWKKDWEQLRVGDKWDAQAGFAPGEFEGK